jgi:hypothetical protein
MPFAFFQGGPAEAPSNGATYGRKDGSWADIAQAAILQLRRGTEAERSQITPLEGEPIYAADSKKLYLGDGTTPGGNEIVSGDRVPQQNPTGMARMVTVRSSGSVNVTVRSTTGYVASRWWDGSVQVFGSGAPGSDISVSKAVPASGNWSASSPKEIFLWSCTAGNATQSGHMTRLLCQTNGVGNALASLDVSGLASLASLDCSFNQLTSLNVSGLAALGTLSCNSNQLTSLDLSRLTSLTSLNCSGNQLNSLNVSGLALLEFLGSDANQLTSLNVSGLTSLRYLGCISNPITSLNASGCTAMEVMDCYDNYQLTSLNVSGLTSLTSLICYNTQLTSLNLSGLSSLRVMDFSNAQITSLRAVGVSLSDAGLSNVTNNALNASALNQFYADLAPGSATIAVIGNPGVAGDSPAIAVAKGYTIFGSD